jgi:predicted PurR-regulated permease PerM
MAGALRELADCEVVPLRRSLIPVARPCCDDGDMTDNARPPLTRRARLWAAAEAKGVPLRTILTVALVVIAVYMLAKVVYRLRDVLLLIIVAAFIAVILNPAVVALQRWKIKRRGWAVAVVTFWGLIVFAGLAFSFGYPLANGINHLALKLPDYVAAATHGRGWLGHLVTRYHVQTWVNKNAPKLVSFGEGLAKPALSLGAGALTLLLELFTIFVLVLLLLLEGPKMRTALLGGMAPDRAERYRRIAHEVNRSVTGYMLGNVLTSVIAGAVVYVTLLVMGVPFPFLWALWVALVDFLPMIGGALAGIPTVLFAAAHSLTAGIVTLVVFLIYTQLENHVLNPIVMSRTVRVNPLLVLLSILVGGEIGSWIGGIFGAFVGALLAIPAAGALQVIVREVWHATDPLAAAAGMAGHAVNTAANTADGAAADGAAGAGQAVTTNAAGEAGPDGAARDGAAGAGPDGADSAGRDGAGGPERGGQPSPVNPGPSTGGSSRT